MANNENLQRGGNEGNRLGGGRKRNAVRAKYLRGADKAVKFLNDIIDWKPVIPVPGVAGKPETDTKRKPTFEEWRWAEMELAKYGLGTRIDADLSMEHSGRVEVPGLEDALRRAYGDQPS